jgi:hypothetical protein
MNASLDYLFQYPVKSVIKNNDGSGIAIEFGGHEVEGAAGAGAIIGIKDANMEFPDLAGKALITVVRSADGTRMIFGRVADGQVVDGTEIPVAPGDYFICDPRFGGGEPFYPDAPVIEDDREASIREQFNERFQDGPDEPVEAQKLGVEHFDPEHDHGA